MQTEMIVWLIVVGLAGVVIGWLVARGRAAADNGVLRERLAARERELQAAQGNLGIREAAFEKEQATANVLREEIAGLKAQIESARESARQRTEDENALKDAFSSLAAAALRTNNQTFVNLAKDKLGEQQSEAKRDLEAKETAIKNLLQPVQETMTRLDKRVEESNMARSNAETLLNQQIDRLAGASESLSNALRKPVVRGSWGEMTLENALESAGLRADIDYVLQHTTEGEDGRLRTDAVINLPKGRKLVIDSKNLMESYLAYSKATDGAQRAICAEVHSRALRTHIKDLWSKKYTDRYEGPDCVILFIPHDGMYHAAIQDESELIREACERRVFVANPMSLIPLLKAVAYVLDQERSNKSASEIQKVGMDLYAELARFAASIANIGSKLQASVKAYNDAIPGLDRFIVSKSRQLKQLGAGKGGEAELPEPVELEPRPFSSRELKTTNLFLPQEDDESELDLAATAEETVAKG